MTDIRTDKGFGYTKADGSIGMMRCFDCAKENYAMAVNSGVCAWCGYDANARKAEEEAA